MANIKVRDLADTTTISSDNQIMVLTNDPINLVQNITVGNFNQNIISTDADNGIEQGSDGGLYVDNADSGVTAGTYQYPQNLVVNEKGQITSVESGSPAAVPIATTSQAGIVKPDGSTITVLSDGTISAAAAASRNVGEIVASTIPLTDAGLHLLDGTVIQGSGIYSAFVDYMAELYGDVGEGYYIEWTQPVLSANGTVGGDSFAVLASSEEQYSSEPYRAFEAFDNNSSTYWRSAGGTKWLEFYNPQPLKVTNLQYANYYNYPTEGNVQGSNNGVDWTTLTTWTNNSLSTFNIDLSSNTNAYTYYRVNITNTSDGADSTIHCVQLNITAQQYVAPEGVPNYFCTEAEWQQSVTDYGVCGKFVYDSANNTVRLPLYNSKIYTGGGEVPVIGNGKALGITNGTKSGGLGVCSYDWSNPQVQQNAYNPVGTSSTLSSFTVNQAIGVVSEGANSGIIADLSEITTSLDGYYYIVVATSTKTDIQVDIDEIATDLNEKVDKSQLVDADVVVERYQSGTSWYRLYNSGWCEQGGRIANSTDGGTSITLLKPYRDTLYTITTSGYITTNTGSTSNNGAAKAAATCSNITTTGFVLYKQSTQPQADWRTCGYVS